YGLAWIKGENKGRVQGTPEYMAPEQAKQGIVNERTDIYNLGATMYRLVTERHPPSVVADTHSLPMSAKTWSQIRKPVGELAPETPAELCDLIHRCLEFNPQKRPERMSEIQGTLDHLADKLACAPEDQLESLD